MSLQKLWGERALTQHGAPREVTKAGMIPNLRYKVYPPEASAFFTDLADREGRRCCPHGASQWLKSDVQEKANRENQAHDAEDPNVFRFSDPKDGYAPFGRDKLPFEGPYIFLVDTWDAWDPRPAYDRRTGVQRLPGWCSLCTSQGMVELVLARILNDVYLVSQWWCQRCVETQRDQLSPTKNAGLVQKVRP